MPWDYTSNNIVKVDLKRLSDMINCSQVLNTIAKITVRFRSAAHEVYMTYNQRAAAYWSNADTIQRFHQISRIY